MKTRLALLLITGFCACNATYAIPVVTIDVLGTGPTGMEGQVSFWGSHAAAQAFFPGVPAIAGPEGETTMNGVQIVSGNGTDFLFDASPQGLTALFTPDIIVDNLPDIDGQVLFNTTSPSDFYIESVFPFSQQTDIIFAAGSVVHLPDIWWDPNANDTTLASEFTTFGAGTTQIITYYTAAPVCDFSGDLLCNAADINLMFAQGNLVTGVSVDADNPFDLNSDNNIDGADITEWLRLAGANNGYGGGDPNNPNAPFVRGDTDDLGNIAPMPRTVDITDFVNFLRGFTGSCGNWECGNFDGDDGVDATDFVALLPNFNAYLPNGQYGPGQAIPEPSTMVLLGCGALWLGYLLLRGSR